jgi:hypothetical protein
MASGVVNPVVAKAPIVPAAGQAAPTAQQVIDAATAAQTDHFDAANAAAAATPAAYLYQL